MKHILFIIYIFSSVFTLVIAIFYPFLIMSEEFPAWSGWIIGPLVLLIIFTQGKVLNYFKDIL